MANRTVSVTLAAKVDQYVSGMKKAGAATTELSKSTKTAMRQQELLGKAAGVVGVAVAAAFGKKIVNAASDMNESVSKSGVVFGKNAAAVQKWAGSSAKAFGLSTQKALEASSTFGNLFVSMGLAEDRSAEMSMSLVQLAGDLASFNNINPTEALDALRAGLVGETEPLRRLGVNLNDAELRLKALNMGLVTSTKDVLPPAIKSQAAYALILEQTKTAQGDYARTADGLANSQRTLNAQWEDTQAKLGEGLLPAANGAVQGLSSLLDVVNAAPPGLRNAGLAAAAAGAAFLVAAPRVLAMRTALEGMPETAAKVKKGSGLVVKSLAAITAASLAIRALSSSGVNSGLTELEGTLKGIAAGSGGMDKLGFSIGVVGEETDSFTDALDRAANANAWDRINRGFSDFLGVDSSLKLAEDSVRAVDEALASMVKNGMGGEAYRAVERFKEQLLAEGRSLDLLSASNLPNYRDALDSVTKYQGEVGDSASDAAGEVESFADAIEKLNAPTRDAAEAQMGLIENAKDLATGLKENGRSFDMSTEAGRKNLGSLLDTIDGIEEYGAAIEAKTGSQDKARAAIEKERDALIDNLIASGVAEKKAKALVDRYLKMPAATKQAADGIDDVTAALNRMPTEKTVTITVKGRNMRLLAADTLASGGPVVGPGSGTSDSVPIMASNGEWVMSAASVRKYGPDFMAAVNAGRVRQFASGSLVDQGFAGAGSGSSSGGGSRRRRRSSGGGSGGGARMTWDRGLMDSVASANGLFDGFDMNAWAEATERVKTATEGLADARKSLVSAEDDVAAARRAVNQAGTPEEQARAQEQLTEALRAKADAERDVTRATLEQSQAINARKGTRLTSDNVVAKFRQRAQKLDKFRRDLQTLRKRGLSRAIIQEIIDAGIEEGGAMAAALVAGNDIASLNAIYGDIRNDSRGIARTGLLTESSGSGGGTGGGGGTTGSTGASTTVALTIENASRPFIVKMDSEQVWRGLVKLKKSKGGASLGLS